MKYIILLISFIGLSSISYAQNDVIRGQEFICYYQDSMVFDYELILDEPNGQSLEVVWAISPNGAYISYSDGLSAGVIFQWPGQYVLTATYFSANGETIITEKYICVSDNFTQPFVSGCAERDPGSNCYQVCEYSENEIFIEASCSDWTEWTVIGAESYNITGSGVYITWGAAGSGEVYYFTECSQQTYPLCFDILPTPEADFETTPGTSGDTLTICKEQEIYFENTSVNGMSYHWFFGDGTEFDGYDASHAYTEEGFFTAKLVASGACDCSDEKELVIQVLDQPAPTLDCVNSVCPETRQKYTATTDGCTVFNWSIGGDGTIVNGGESTDDFIEVIWHSGPDGIINLSVSGCASTYCSGSNTFRVPIITPDGPLEGDASVCSGEIVTYTAPYFPGTVYNWSVSSQGMILSPSTTNAVTIRWNDVNAVTTGENVSVNYDNCFLECSGQDNIAVQITPSIALTGDNQVCMGDQATVSAQAGFSSPVPANVTWEIRNEDGATVFTSATVESTFTHTFNYPAGNYYWVAINNSPNYCNDEILFRITVSEKPDAPLGIDGELEICPGVTYGYTIDNAGDYETNWVVTDGSNITNYSGQVINHTFGMNPPYAVQATHIDVQFPDCQSDPVTITMTNAADKDIVGNEEACYQSIETYTIDFIGGSSYEWEIIPADHGDIQSQSSNEINVFWTQSGPATVRLNACGVVVDLAVTVHTLPVFTVLGPTEACSNETPTFSTDEPTLSHEWKNENGTIIGNDPTADLLPGFYSVTVTDVFGCQHSENFDLRLIPAPRVSISSPVPSFTCAENPIPLVANTDGDDYMFTWYRDNVIVGSGPTHTGSGFGTYEVEAVNQYGCTDRSSGFVYGECCPISDCERDYAACPPGCATQTTDFDVAITNTDCQTKTYTNNSVIEAGSHSWTIKRLNQILANYTGNGVEHEYALPGYYTIIARGRLDGEVYPDPSCFHFEIMTDSVLLVADYDVNIACVGEEFEFEDLTTFLPSQSITAWSWNFGDPASGVDNTSADQNPRHTFAAAGIYDVVLTATSESGCESSITKQVNVSGGPDLIVDFDLINCEEEATSFHLNGNVFNVGWDFGDPTAGIENSAEVATTLHTFNSAGNYNVTVTAEDVYQCLASTQVQVDIRANTLAGDIDVQLSNSFCQGESATLTAPTGGNYWEWSSGENTDAITVSASDEYSVFIRDENNCSYTTPAEFIEVLPKPVVLIKARVIYGPNNYGPWIDQIEVCQGVEFELHAVSTQNLNYLWNNSSSSQVLIFASDGGSPINAGDYIFSVTGTDPVSGCPADEQSISVTIHGLPAVPNISLTSGSACSFDDNIIEVNSPQPNTTYIWSDGQEGSAVTISSAGNYYVTAVNEYGCERNSNVVNVKASASIDQLPSGCHIECDPLTVCLPSIPDVNNYTIYQNNTSWMTGTAWPSDFVIDSDGSYTIEVTTNNGCVAISDPLDILLYQGTGIVTVSTYVDVDNDGAISAADTLISGIGVEILSGDGMHEGRTLTEADGRFDFVDYPTSTYTASIDQDLLLPIWIIVIDNQTADIVNCNDSVSVSLLIKQNCQVIGPDVVHEMCPGDMFSIADSTWVDTGYYEMHLVSDIGCDSLFFVEINLPDSFEINITVSYDVDGDMNNSPADTLLPGIPIIVTDLNSGINFNGQTDLLGEFIIDVPVGDYRVAVDTFLLSSDLDPIYWETIVFATSICAPGTGGPILFLLGQSCQTVVVPMSESICFGDSLEINGVWYRQSGNYPYSEDLDGDGCDTLIDFTLSVLPELIVEYELIYDCDGTATIEIIPSGVEPFNVNWSPILSSNFIESDLIPGLYTVLVIDGNNCSEQIEIEVLPQPTLNFQLNALYDIVEGESVILEITGTINEPGLSVVWEPDTDLSCGDCFAPEASPNETTEYVVTITDMNGCTYELNTTVAVAAQAQVFIPTAFTPDDDGLNDFFRLSSDDTGAQIINLKVINRWGDVVYQEENVNMMDHIGWDGYVRSKKIDSQVVIYFVEVLMTDGRREKMSGDLTILR